MSGQWLGLTCVAVLAAILAVTVVAISLTQPADDRAGLEQSLPPFTLVYERITVGSHNGELTRPHREVIELRWRGESAWRRTILYSEGGRHGETGDWQQADGRTLTSSYSDPETLDEPGDVWGPEVWFRQPPKHPRADNERIEKVGQTGYTRWTREYPF